MPTRVWLIRHAQAINSHLFHGFESDADLSELGEQQAKTLATAIHPFSPDVVVSSNMLRARKTATAIASKCECEHVIFPDFHERIIGLLSGTDHTHAENPWHVTVEKWKLGEIEATTPGAESFLDLQKRVLPSWHKLTTRFQDRFIILVSHGITIRVLALSLISGWSAKNWNQLSRTANTSITELIQTERGWALGKNGEVMKEVLNLSETR
jgi:broad specificity phosphatase PhoE